MKFIVDAQLPYLLAKFIRQKGFDVIHTDDLPDKERTSDNEIRRISLKEKRIVISKDEDFVNSFMINNSPEKLLWISTGNITNHLLITLFEKNFDNIIAHFSNHNLIELDNNDLIFHE